MSLLYIFYIHSSNRIKNSIHTKKLVRIKNTKKNKKNACIKNSIEKKRRANSYRVAQTNKKKRRELNIMSEGVS